MHADSRYDVEPSQKTSNILNRRLERQTTQTNHTVFFDLIRTVREMNTRTCIMEIEGEERGGGEREREGGGEGGKERVEITSFAYLGLTVKSVFSRIVSAH